MWRWGIAAVVAMAVAPVAADDPALGVALTNDDGWDAIGVRVLHGVLAAHGYRVTWVGSATQQSGSSAALNAAELMVTRRGPRVFSVALLDGEGAEPLTAGMVAIDIAARLDGRAPDLLVSGINSGANIGSGTLHSGTVGAVIGALNRGINGSLPGVAISTDQPDCDEACVEAHYRTVAEFGARLLARLANGARLLEPGIGLNVNYPPLPAAQIKGVRVARQGQALGIFGGPRVLHYACEACPALEVGAAAPASAMRPTDDGADDVPDSDVTWFYDGYVTIVPIAADYTAASYQRFVERLSNLTP